MLSADALRMTDKELRQLKGEIESLNVQNNFKRNPVKDSLGKDEFLKILTVQMSHQDPLAPMDNKDMIAQLAQFSSVEQMLEVNKTLSVMKDMYNGQTAYSMLGRTIDFMDEAGNMTKGYVNSLMNGDTGIALAVHTESGVTIPVDPSEVLMVHATEQIVKREDAATEK